MEPVRISTPLAEAEIYPYGAHLTQWTPRGHRPVLYVSPKSSFVPGRAIRGGVPIIFPWFGPRSDGSSGPAHGFARTSEWTLEEQTDASVALSLASSAATRALFDGEFRVQFRIHVGTDLRMELQTTNLGQRPFTFEEALHTYFAVGAIEQTTVTGLEGAIYHDKTENFRVKTQDGQPIRFTAETDRMYLDTQTTCTIHDGEWKRAIVVEKHGSRSTVVWNPWMGKTHAMSDMDPEGWRNMVCVETANAGGNAIRLAPGTSHALSVIVSLAS
jgi:glucose-6-phosphate 1-epimerase